MDANALASSIGDLAMALVFGGMAMFSFIVAPAAFKAIGTQQAGALMRALFPLYYRVMAIASAIGAVAFAFAGRHEEWALAGVALGFVAMLYIVLPAVIAAQTARDAGASGAAARFAKLHGLSIALNIGLFLVVFATMIGLL